jgi:Gluconate 2-dehydrogenase subunit 3
MTRRHLFWLVSRVAATAAGQAFLSSWLAEAHEAGHEHSAPPSPDRWKDYSPRFFSNDDFQALDQFVAVLIPTDETPGAREAHVAQFIDFLLNAAGEYAPEMQKQWRDAADWMRAREFGRKSAADQIAFMLEVSQPPSTDFVHFQLIKDLTVYAFYTSREGLIDNLEYKGLAYLTEFPGCTHEEHRAV